MQEITERMVTVIVLQALAIFFLGVTFAPTPIKIVAAAICIVSVMWVERQPNKERDYE